MRANTDGAEILARACAELGIPLVTFSTDLVFDGRLGRPYVESDAPAPATVYGLSKREAERRVLAAHDRALVVRTSAFFGPWDRENFVWHALRSLAAGEAFEARRDVVSPTYVPDLAHAVLDLLVDGEGGLWHVANPGAIAWSALAREAARLGGYDLGLIRETGDAPALDTALTSERGVLLPPLESALDRFFRDSEVDWAQHQRAAVAAE
jgi:dTDP-4-dehydrorhamnose reductase